MTEDQLVSQENQRIESGFDSSSTGDEEEEEQDEEDEGEEEEEEQSQVNDSKVERVIDNDVVLPKGSDSFGHINVEKSRNVNLGSRTFIKGPVTIQQILQTNPGSNNFPEIRSSPSDIPENETKKDLKSSYEQFDGSSSEDYRESKCKFLTFYLKKTH